MQSLWQDIRYGLRMMFKAPGFSAVVILSLALGLGANTTIFSLVNALLLRPLPVEDPGRLARLQLGAQGTSFPNYSDLRERTKVFSGLAAHSFTPLTLGEAEGAQRITGEIVSGNYFDVLGVRFAQGRPLSADDDLAPGAHPVAVISHNLWRRYFNSAPDAVGRRLILNGYNFTVIGVAPRQFTGTFIGYSPDVWVPLMMQGSVQGSDRLETRDSRWLQMTGRLAPGVSVEQASSAVRTAAAQLEREYPDANKGLGRAQVSAATSLHPMMRGPVTVYSILLLVVTGLVLLIACTNIANLLLARAAGRQREIGVRLAMGATRRRLVRQLLTESILLSLCGCLVGMLIAYWLTTLISQYQPSLPVTVDLDVRLDRSVLAFATAMAVLVGIVFGLAPALQASKPNLVASLKAEGQTFGRRRFRLQDVIVVMQISLSLVLLVGAGLFIRSMQNARQIDPGFKSDNLLLMSADMGAQSYSESRGKELFKQIGERVRGLPGVRSYSWASVVPLSLVRWTSRVNIPDNPQPVDAQRILIDYNVVGDGYFETMGIPVVKGRAFSPQDDEGAAGVVIVNEAMAQRYWPGQDPLGKALSIKGPKGPFLTVVGVAKNGKYNTLGEDVREFMYLPFTQNYAPGMTLHIKGEGDPRALAAVVRRETQLLDKGLSYFDVKTMSEHLDLSLWLARVGATFLGVFGLLALALAVIGIYGVTTYSVSGQTRDIAIRMALGAQKRDILRRVLGKSMVLVLIGVGVGAALAVAGLRALSSFLYGVSATDPLTFLLVGLLLCGVALLASYLPAQKAATVNPNLALRHD